ncbi:MAG: M20 family metallopeptidase [Candidatus Omnitrophota bacterium]|nr:MAG: M20 family metallopeptidase [Candidatus Omnitrophota bacterium]
MKKDVVRLLKDLIKIDSQNPPGNERKIIYFIRDYLKSLGIHSEIYEFKKNRMNLICKIPSKNSKKTILLTPHVDTVPAEGIWKFPPFGAKVDKGRVYGRGATDCKSNVAVSLALLARLKEKNKKFKNLDLVFAFCGDEETGSNLGIKPLMKYLKNIDYAAVLDADEFNIIVAQKGLLHLRVELFGKEAHGAYPERGINAIEKGVNILKEINDKGFIYKAHPSLKKPTLNVGRFCGGTKVNIVAARAFFELDIRYIPSMNKKAIINAIEKIIKKEKIKYKMQVLAQQDPIEIDTQSFLIKTLKKVLKEHKIKPALKPSFGATVINFLKEKGIETFAFGFGSKGCAHTQNEYVRISNLEKGVYLLKDYLVKLDACL